MGNVIANMSVVLERWNPRLGRDQYIALGNGSLAPVQTEPVEKIDGWYAEYKEGLFAFWQNGHKQFVRWRNSEAELTPGLSVRWASRMSHRQFVIESGQDILLRAKYHTLLREPWRIVVDFLAPDDDWGLVNDLPSWVHSGFVNGDLAQQLARWNEKRGT